MTLRTAAGADYHVARLLLLLDAFGGPRRRYLVGLTKLAKLDFLLRYPRALFDLMISRGVSLSEELAPTALEEQAIESPMIRYKFGPWDQQYYALIGRLVGLGLAEQNRGPRREIRIRLTKEGRVRAAALAESPQWAQIAGRAAILAEHFSEISGASLTAEIYAQFGDMLDRPHWSVIR